MGFWFRPGFGSGLGLEPNHIGFKVTALHQYQDTGLCTSAHARPFPIEMYAFPAGPIATSLKLMMYLFLSLQTCGMAAQSDDVGVLRFHERCGEAVIVGDNGMTVEKREKLQQADIEHGGLCKYVSFVCQKKKIKHRSHACCTLLS